MCGHCYSATYHFCIHSLAHHLMQLRLRCRDCLQTAKKRCMRMWAACEAECGENDGQASSQDLGQFKDDFRHDRYVGLNAPQSLREHRRHPRKISLRKHHLEMCLRLIHSCDLHLLAHQSIFMICYILLQPGDFLPQPLHLFPALIGL